MKPQVFFLLLWSQCLQCKWSEAFDTHSRGFASTRPPIHLPQKAVGTRRFVSSPFDDDNKPRGISAFDEMQEVFQDFFPAAVPNIIADEQIEEISQMTLETPSNERKQVTDRQDLVRDREDQILTVLAAVPAIMAFFLWEDVSHALAVFLDKYGAIGRVVDGGQFTVGLLRPTITGVVVPVISIALATLVSTTVNVLRERQVELRALVNKEACELRLLRRTVFGMFGTRQHATRRAKALSLICSYVEQLEKECSVGAIDTLEKLQLRGGISVNELDRLSEMLHSVDGAAASRQGSVAAADGLIISLNSHRSNRVARLLSVFPAVHWGLLAALSFSVCFTFLLNSNQQVLQYLNSIQLRTLFGILVGVLSGLTTLCFNLADPFRGSFSITQAATQLGDLRISLKRDVAEAHAEGKEISSKIIQSLLLAGDRNPERSSETSVVVNEILSEVTNTTDDMPAATEDDDLVRRRYGLVSTIYFHLLTGPLGSNARMIGDVIAWVASFATHCVRSSSRRLVTWSRSFRRWLSPSKQTKDSKTENLGV